MYKFAVLNYLVVIMNLIPLLELDGYYILADLIEIPDLRERSLVFMRRDLFHKLTDPRALLQAGRGSRPVRRAGHRVHDLLAVHGLLLLADRVRRPREPAVATGAGDEGPAR